MSTDLTWSARLLHGMSSMEYPPRNAQESSAQIGPALGQAPHVIGSLATEQEQMSKALRLSRSPEVCTWSRCLHGSDIPPRCLELSDDIRRSQMLFRRGLTSQLASFSCRNSWRLSAHPDRPWAKGAWHWPCDS